MKKRKVALGIAQCLTFILLIVAVTFVVILIVFSDYITERSELILLPLAEISRSTCYGSVISLTTESAHHYFSHDMKPLTEDPARKETPCNGRTVKKFDALGKRGPDDIFEFQVAPRTFLTVTIHYDKESLVIWTEGVFREYPRKPTIYPEIYTPGLRVESVEIAQGGKVRVTGLTIVTSV